LEHLSRFYLKYFNETAIPTKFYDFLQKEIEKYEDLTLVNKDYINGRDILEM
jgi:hypothetical protein